MDDSLDADLEWLIDDDAEVSDEGKVTGEKDKVTSNSPSPEPITKSGSEDDTDDDGDDGLTHEERELLERNTYLNDAADRDDYDLRNKVEQANADLERTGLDSARETRVMFKQKLVDVEAPPLDYGEDSHSSSSSSSESEDEKDKAEDEQEQSESNKDESDEGMKEDKENSENEKTEADDKEAILVEKGGKFELMKTSENRNSSSSSSSDEEKANLPKVTNQQPERKERPRTAPISSTFQSQQTSYPATRARPSSASNEYSHIRSPYALSPEMKALMRKRAAARAAREEEERAQERAKQEENRQNAELAWKCWVDKKDQEMKERKRLEDERKQNNDHDSKKEADEAYELWLKEKRKQAKKQRFLEQQRQIEVDEGWYRRDRKECDKAYKQWLSGKDRQARERQKYETKTGYQTRADAYRMKKLKRLLTSIQNSHKYSY